MGVYVILHKANRRDVRIMSSHKLFHKKSIVNGGPSFPSMEDTPTSHRLKSDQHTASLMTLILVVFTLQFPRLHWNRCQNITHTLAWPFVKTYDWLPWIIGLLVNVENILHMPDGVARDFSYPPTLDSPRFKCVFCRAVLTVGSAMDSTTSNSTSLSASHCTVHVPYPAGGSDQANIVKMASTLPSIFAGAPLRGFSSSALLTPTARYSLRTRYIVVLFTPHTLVMSSSVCCSSVNNKIRARLMALADFFPCFTYFCSC